ncbi:hypothetical protein NX801_30350 [Streptomyces sp. LP05-1]|uniref:Lipoprotein n=1 Tax=Streptomyces pyxinae TaxID=2970734 RepID=A0ABT2CQZ1_9ACTN|nr:hypothetical protein [Streptomyces sp. LP05-1]MCS0639860.1 hypothetical protein [Streptomyces sp. LP05-1]
MRAIGIASAALLGAAALSLTTPASAADPDGSGHAGPATRRGAGDYAVSPSTVAPGGRVVLTAPGCAGTAMASAGIFDTATIARGGSATAVVDWDARRGAAYTVSFTCATGATPSTVRLTVSAAGGTATANSTAVPTVTATRTATTTMTATRSGSAVAPSQGVRGGLGGSVGGWNTGQLVAGSGLVVAAVTGVIYVVRRRAEDRRH